MTLLTTTKEMRGSCTQAPSALCMLHEIVFFNTPLSWLPSAANSRGLSIKLICL